MGCGEARPPLGDAVCESWKVEIAPALEAACGSCHAGAEPAGGLDLTRYEEAEDLGAPELEAAERLPGHEGVPNLRERYLDWVGRCGARYTASTIHLPGIMSQGQGDFHGQLIRSSRYDLDRCQDCHGADYAGGASEVSCLGCHPAGPTACETCHGALSPPHQRHGAFGSRATEDVCGACHEVPLALLDPGHVLAADGALDVPPAEVLFSGSAAYGPPTSAPPRETGTPSYEGGQCRNVYCHGGTLDDPAAQSPVLEWSEGGGLDCGSCHGDPPASHASDRCRDCHPAAFRDDGDLDPGAHLDGSWTFAAGSDCGGCHGDAPTGAPPPNLDGDLDRLQPGVGAHGPHLNPRLGLSTAVACTECHLVPERIDDAGHIDSALPAEVFPDGASGVAWAEGSRPRYDAVNQSCAGTWCHGEEALGWTELEPGRVFCGSCHGIPPPDARHRDVMLLSECSGCHAASVTASGSIRFEGGETRHLDGVVDANGEGP